MRDIPFFTTENGIATLILKEIPYKAHGYVLVHSAAPGRMERLLRECAAFCRMAGAERVFVRGEDVPEALPVYAQIWEMSAGKARLPAPTATLEPLTAQTGEGYRRLMNRRMAAVPCAATLERRDLERLLQIGGGYLVLRNGETIGAGQVAGDEISLLTATVPRAGGAVVSALASAISAPRVRVRVALENKKALALYRRLGFQMEKAVEIWRKLP